MHDINDQTHQPQLDLRTSSSLPVSGIIYTPAVQFTQAQMEQTLAELLQKVTGDSLRILDSGLSIARIFEQKVVRINGTDISLKTSWMCAGFSGEPSFLTSGEIELKIGYIIISELEIDNKFYCFIQRLHIGDPFECGFNGALTPPLEVAFRKIVASISSEASRIETIHMKYMTTSKYELRAKTVESFDTANNLSPAGMYRTIASRVKVADIKPEFGTNRASVAASSNKISLGLTSLIFNDWESVVAQLIFAVHNSKPRDHTLSRFAQEKASLAGAEPKSILFDIHTLETLFRSDGTKKLTSKTAATHDEILSDLLKEFTEPFILEKLNPQDDYSSSPGRSIVRSIKVTPRTKTCNVSLPKCDIKFDGEPISLIIDKEKAFRITFSDPSLFFCREGLLGIGNIKDSAKILGNIIFGDDVFKSASSEKGNLDANSEHHVDDSLFHCIAKGLCKDTEYLICDDGTDEWGDFFGLSLNKGNPVATWYHAKMDKRDKPIQNGRTASGAGGLQVVVAQALKNLGRARTLSSDPEFKERQKTWGLPYVFPEGHITTKISRFTSTIPGATVRKFGNSWENAALSPNTIYQSAIVIPDYKKSFFTTLISRVGSSLGNETDLQVFYLLSAFMGGCFEMGIRPVIYCRN